MDRGAWRTAVHAVVRVRHDLATKASQVYCFLTVPIHFHQIFSVAIF